MSNKKICKFTKLNQYFYMTPDGNILKYKNFVLLLTVKNYLHLITLIKNNPYIVMNVN